LIGEYERMELVTEWVDRCWLGAIDYLMSELTWDMFRRSRHNGCESGSWYGS
jgi:hypothetical protein